MNEKAQNETEMKRITRYHSQGKLANRPNRLGLLFLSRFIYQWKVVVGEVVQKASCVTSIFNAAAIAIYLYENPFSYDVHTYAPKRQRQQLRCQRRRRRRRKNSID